MVTPERWGLVKAVLDGALEKRPGERAAFVATACGEDSELRGEVESLLEFEEGSAGFIEEPLFGRFAGGLEGLAEGQRVGPYRVVREIGRGGMGAVYLAARADEEFDQRVALKLVGTGSATEIVRRFRAERQILAHLDHPNIAKLLDGGTAEDGRPYFVMEYVEGRPIDEYAGKLPLRERLALFREVCAAVHFAHQNLVVHRDLKPANVLVTADGVPKLLDFGIAKLIDPGGTDPGLSELGLRPMTLQYASPEQVGGKLITTASDVYALGVLLYVLLTGRSPYSTAADDRAALERAITQGETVRPSQAAERREDARRLTGDLDTLVLRAMDLKPERRYASAEQLAADVQRYLDGLPVLARKDTAGYRLSKFVQRHKLGVAAAAAVLLLILGFSVTVTLLLKKAERERDRAEAVSGFLVDLFTKADPDRSRGETITAREVLDRGRKQIAGDLEAAPETRAALMETMGRVYRSLGLYDQAGPLLEDSLRLRRQIRGTDPLDVAASEINLALTLQEGSKRRDDAEPLIREALEIYRRQGATADRNYAAGLNNLGGLLKDRGDYAAAEPIFREALRLKQKILGADEDVATAYNNLGNVLYAKGDLAGAEPYLRQGLAMRRKLLGSEPHPEMATSLNNLASLLEAKGERAEAEKLYREVLAMRRKLFDGRGPKVAQSLSNLAFILLAEGRPAEAEPFTREALSIESEHPSPKNRAVFLRQLAAALAGQGKGREAESAAREALAIFRTAKMSWRVADGESVLGGSLAAQGRFAEAEPLLLGSYRILKADPGEGAQYAPAALARIINLYTAWGRPDRAAPWRALAGSPSPRSWTR
ncbi:MAG TPA: serine/threonine-protein kinase [Thermoanaerobaculia bacterium]|jgi:serine/threonine-protein kinase|nr:serine/threonine-protein kinase [Thermoanaerobaculia bacterium]